MRKPIAILSLGLLLFNILGNYGVFIGIKFHNDRKVVRQLDAGTYDPAETFVIKLPVAIPYANDSREYSRIDGSFHLNGQSYRLVKQAYVKDTLHIVCLKDEKGTMIDRVLDDIAGTFTDNTAGERAASSGFADLIKDYLTSTLAVASDCLGWQREVSGVRLSLCYHPADQASVIHPPERFVS